MRKVVFLTLGFVSLAAGFIGLFLPVVPTTPFLILAAFFFSRGSVRMHRWLLEQPHFGPRIREWETYGVIPTRVKVIASVLVVAGMTYPIGFTEMMLELKIAAVSLAILGMAFVWSRPSSPSSGSVRRRAARSGPFAE